MAPPGGVVRWRSWGESFTKLEICLSVTALAFVCTILLLEAVWIAKSAGAGAERPAPEDERDPALETVRNLTRRAEPWPPGGRFLSPSESGSVALMMDSDDESEAVCAVALLSPRVALTTDECAALCRSCKISGRTVKLKMTAVDGSGDPLNLAALTAEDFASDRYARYLAGPRMSLNKGDVLLALTTDGNRTEPFGSPIELGVRNSTAGLPPGTPLMRGEALYGFVAADAEQIVRVEDAAQWIFDYVSGKL